MEKIISSIGIYNLIWVIPVLFSIHEFEEWNILKWYKKHYTNLPDSTNYSIHLHIIVLSTVSYLLTFTAYLLKDTFVFDFIIFFLTCFILFNITQHIIWTIQLKAYSVGLITGIVCLSFCIFIDTIFMINNKLNPLYFTMVLIFVIPIINTAKVKGEMTKEVLNVHIFFRGIEKRIKGIV